MQHKINLNQTVRVFLTEEGIQRFRSLRQELNNILPKDARISLEPIYESDGSYRNQLWAIMRDFGDMCAPGKFPPFEMNIILEDDLSQAQGWS